MARKVSHKVKVNRIWGLTRISLGLIFLWAFFDKLFGLGFATCRNPETDVVTVGCSSSWIEGGSPTTGFLDFATKGPFAEFYQSLAGQAWVDWIFMLGLLGIGVGLTLGIAMRLSVTFGSILLFMMWTAALPPEHHPFISDHIVYILVLVGLAMVNKDQEWGFRKRWVEQPIVKNASILE